LHWRRLQLVLVLAEAPLNRQLGHAPLPCQAHPQRRDPVVAVAEVDADSVKVYNQATTASVLLSMDRLLLSQ
jgi:hypothetical protein